MNTEWNIDELARQVAACYLTAHGHTFAFEGIVLELDESNLSNNLEEGIRGAFMTDANDFDGELQAIRLLLAGLNEQRNGLSPKGVTFVTNVLRCMAEDVIDLLCEAATGDPEALALVRKVGEFR